MANRRSREVARPLFAKRRIGTIRGQTIFHQDSYRKAVAVTNRDDAAGFACPLALAVPYRRDAVLDEFHFRREIPRRVAVGSD